MILEDKAPDNLENDNNGEKPLSEQDISKLRQDSELTELIKKMRNSVRQSGDGDKSIVPDVAERNSGGQQK